MENWEKLYNAHIQILQQRTRAARERFQFDALLIHSGTPITAFLDDGVYPFKVNPHFKAWVPITHVPHCWLWIDGINKPKLWFYSPSDYWHSTPPLTESFWQNEIEIHFLNHADAIFSLFPHQMKHCVYIGSDFTRASQLGINDKNVNPTQLIDFFHYYRAYKTDYEILCMRKAQKSALSGHAAAKHAFFTGMSEFDINQAYLKASGQSDSNVPYDNIVAINSHSSVLHYTLRDRYPPSERLSLLVDAGAEYLGYAADLTRTYVADSQKHSLYAELLQAMTQETAALIHMLKPGVRFTNYNEHMHLHIARLLLKFELVKNLTEETLMKENLTHVFFPHGIGHLLGLQVHDVAGLMQDESGKLLPAPEKYPSLRCTRILEPGMVLTIEPGFYLIDILLARLKESQFGPYFNWAKIKELCPFGGIRIEDNVVVYEQHVENITREQTLM